MPEKRQRIANLSVMMENPKAEEIFKEALILESGRFVARDIGNFFFLNLDQIHFLVAIGKQK